MQDEGSGEKVTIARRVLRQLEGDILSNRLPPATRITENQQADRIKALFNHDISRVPVREAFCSLRATGLVVDGPDRGTYVAQQSTGLMEERMAAFAIIETACIRLFATRLNRAERERLPLDDWDRLLAAIHSRCGNHVMSEMADNLATRIKYYRHREAERADDADDRDRRGAIRLSAAVMRADIEEGEKVVRWRLSVMAKTVSPHLPDKAAELKARDSRELSAPSHPKSSVTIPTG